jgi:hypothetical protein
MFSYKKIDLLKLTVTNKQLLFDGNTLIIKSPIINYDFNDNKLILKINCDADSHNVFLNLCSYIERLFKNLDIKNLDNKILNNNSVIISIDEQSKFYDYNKDEICKNSIKHGGKIICSFSCTNGIATLIELLQIK